MIARRDRTSPWAAADDHPRSLGGRLHGLVVSWRPHAGARNADHRRWIARPPQPLRGSAPSFDTRRRGAPTASRRRPTRPNPADRLRRSYDHPRARADTNLPRVDDVLNLHPTIACNSLSTLRTLGPSTSAIRARSRTQGRHAERVVAVPPSAERSSCDNPPRFGMRRW